MDDTVKTRYSVLKYLYRPHQVIELSQSKDPRNKEDYHKVENTADGLALAVELLHDGVTGLLKELHVYRGFILQERVNFSYSIPSWCPAHPSITSTDSPFRIKIVCSSRNIAVWYDSPVNDGDSQNAQQAEYKKVYGNFQLNMQDVESTAKIVAAFEQFQQRNPTANLKVSRQNKPNPAVASSAAAEGEDSQNKRQKLTGSPARDTQMLESQQQYSQTSSVGRDALFYSKYIQPSPTSRLASSSPTQLSDSGFASDAFKVPAIPRLNALRGVYMSTPSSSPPPSAIHAEQARQQASSPSNQILVPTRTSSPSGAAFLPPRTDTSSPFHTYPLSVHDATMPNSSTYRPNIAYLRSQANKNPYQQATQYTQATQYEYNQPSFAIDKDRDAFLFDTQSQSQQQESSPCVTTGNNTQLQMQNGMDSYTFPPKLDMTQESSMQVDDDEATEHTLPQLRSGDVQNGKQAVTHNRSHVQPEGAAGQETQVQNVPASILAMEAALSSRSRNIEPQTQTQSREYLAPPTIPTEPLSTSHNIRANYTLSRSEPSQTDTANGAVKPDDQMSTNPMTAAPFPQTVAITQNTSIQIEDTIRDFTSLNPEEAREVVVAILRDPNFASMVNMVYRMPEFRMAG